MTPHPAFCARRALAPLVALLAFIVVCAAQAQALPASVEAALTRAGVPREQLALLVVDAEGARAPRLAWRTQEPMNPASVQKLVTTYAALDLLGPAFTWQTPVYVQGTVKNGVLDGDLYIKGQGDPKLVLERLWLLLRRVQGLGISRIAGDIVLDHSAFDALPHDPAAFDGEGQRPYNAAPDALLVNFQSVVMNFAPMPGGTSAQVSYEPPLAGVALQPTVPLADGPCGDWRAQLRPELADAQRIRFAGAYPARCGDKSWAQAYIDPARYAPRAVAGMWQEMGAKLSGQVRWGHVPDGLAPAFEFASPPLAEVVRDINKFSNNVMAQQLFLTLGLRERQRGNPQAAREVLGQWWRERIDGNGSAPLIDNGSGLSREGRISAAQLGRMLQVAWRSSLMPELAASLPVVGVDGTLKRRQLRSGAAAHLKSGSLRDVNALAGFVDGASGRRYVLVAIANGPNANAARGAFDALIDWTGQDQQEAGGK